MTLKEKFENVMHNWIDEDYDRRDVASELEIDANEFAIEFAEWCIYYREKNRNIYGQILHSLSKYDETYTTKELLEIYKKEKGW